MAKKLTLFSYSKKRKQEKGEADRKIIGFLKAQSVKGKLLVITDAPEAEEARRLGFEVTVVDSDLNTVKEARERNENIDYQYSEFFSFARRMPKDTYDIVYDNSYSNSLLRSRNSKFYKELAKLIKYDGTLITKVLSTQDPYCREHCPKRNWTYVGGHHLNYFTKSRVLKLLNLNGFTVNKYTIAKDRNTHHLLNSTLKAMKL